MEAGECAPEAGSGPVEQVHWKEWSGGILGKCVLSQVITKPTNFVQCIPNSLHRNAILAVVLFHWYSICLSGMPGASNSLKNMCLDYIGG